MSTEIKTRYCQKVVAFDIETTSYTDNDEKRAICYSYCMQVDDDITIMRKAEEFTSFIAKLVEENNINPDNRLVVWVHNLSYEWMFIKFLFEWDLESIFSNGSPLNVIRARTLQGVEFRCTLALTNSPLRTVGEMVGIPKMVGDLDYSLRRHSETPLTDEEIKYIENDVRIIVALIRKCLIDDTFETIPMTKTGYVRRIMRKLRVGRSSSARDYRETIKSLTLTPAVYSMAREAFAGGYTHANCHIAGQVLTDVVAYDLGSSYPSSLAQFTYPMSQFCEVSCDTVEEFEGLIANSCAMVDVTLVGIYSNYSFPPISGSKAREMKGETLDNGRVWSADRVRVVVTDVDLNVIRRAYDIESIEINAVWVAEADYLPTPFVETMLGFYKDKTTLKGVEGAEEEYRLAKENTNSVYGMVGTDPYRTEFTAHEDLTITSESGDLAEVILKHNEDKKRFLYYPWGTWCTAWSRWVLQTTIYDMEDAGVVVAYCDTDSIYAVSHPAIEPIIETANEAITARLWGAAAAHGWADSYDDYNHTAGCIGDAKARELLSPSDRNGGVHPLGVFECETPVPLSRFKTLGAKRYAKESSKGFSITVAGLSKGAAGYIADHGDFDFFSDGMTIPTEHSGRVTHSYSDGIASNYMVDYLGNTAEVFQHGFINLEPAPYHMGLSSEYSTFIETVMEGRL